MDKVYDFLNSFNISDKDSLIVAVSYGPDSMFLLDLLKNKYHNNKIICAHVNHSLRKESKQEAKKLEDYCHENNICFEFMKIKEYKDNKFTEEEARRKRYNFFEILVNKYKSKYLFTAHHGDDLIETVLMRIVRGSNLSGYSGIRLVSERRNYKIIRPLLYLTKEEIKSQCDEKNIPYAMDKSNFNDKYTRNRFRSNILNFLKDENKYVHYKFLDFSNTLLEYENYVNQNVLKVYEKVVQDSKIKIDALKKENKLIIKKVIELYLLDTYGNDIKYVGSKHVNIIMNIINSLKSNIKISMPGKLSIVKSYNNLYFDKEDGYNNFCYVFSESLDLPNNYKIVKINNLENTSNYVTALDSKEISLPIYVRNKIDGDKIEILGLNGEKKLKDIFIDEKVDFDRRKSYPVVVDSKGEVLWLPGLKKSKYDKSKKGNYDIILKYQKGGI